MYISYLEKGQSDFGTFFPPKRFGFRAEPFFPGFFSHSRMHIQQICIIFLKVFVKMSTQQDALTVSLMRPLVFIIKSSL